MINILTSASAIKSKSRSYALHLLTKTKNRFIDEFILPKWNFTRLKVSPLEDAATQQVHIHNSSCFSVYTPSFVGEPVKSAAGDFPEIMARVFYAAKVSAYSPAVISGGLNLPKQILSEHGRITTGSGGLYERLGKTSALSRISGNCVEVRSGIVVGGAGAFNWYHFIVECLPKAFLAQQLPGTFSDFPLIVPEECQTIASFRDALAYFSGNRDLIYLKPGEHAIAGQLVVIDEVSIGPFNLVTGQWPRVSDYKQHDELLKEFFAVLRHKALENAINQGHKRIFLARPSIRRSYNQEELIEIAKDYGFTSVYLDKMTLEEQASTFSNAEIAIGPSGAAWVGLIFRSEPMKCLSWLPAEYSEFSSYSTLSKLLGHQMQYIKAMPHKPIRSTSDAYTAEYTVSPPEFRTALESLCNEK